MKYGSLKAFALFGVVLFLASGCGADDTRVEILLPEDLDAPSTAALAAPDSHSQPPAAGITPLPVDIPGTPGPSAPAASPGRTPGPLSTPVPAPTLTPTPTPTPSPSPTPTPTPTPTPWPSPTPTPTPDLRPQMELEREYARHDDAVSLLEERYQEDTASLRDSLDMLEAEPSPDDPEYLAAHRQITEELSRLEAAYRETMAEEESLHKSNIAAIEAKYN